MRVLCATKKVLRRAWRSSTTLRPCITEVGVHPDIAGYQDLAHAFDLKAAALAARATLEAARERRETRGCHNRSDYPDPDSSLQVNLVWSPARGIEGEAIAAVSHEIAKHMRRPVTTADKLVE